MSVPSATKRDEEAAENTLFHSCPLMMRSVARFRTVSSGLGTAGLNIWIAYLAEQ